MAKPGTIQNLNDLISLLEIRRRKAASKALVQAKGSLAQHLLNEEKATLQDCIDLISSLELVKG